MVLSFILNDGKVLANLKYAKLSTMQELAIANAL